MKNLLLMRNSKGEKDGCWTFALISFIIVSLIVVLSIFRSFSFGGFVISLEEPNVPLLTLYFGGAFTTYVVRRNTKDKASKIEAKTEEKQV